ncbi:hypothetical protein DPEC_G00031450 [Dallia pectoralis]|uniref:Uncharacterized protein n=1 Tax=Dallia pectoralis TaxID=75939 RepID=A0ACC2HD48_DALPE|nr:hypothetical protein DPEC_G00031450 [Dallia pectoralis]
MQGLELLSDRFTSPASTSPATERTPEAGSWHKRLGLRPLLRSRVRDLRSAGSARKQRMNNERNKQEELCVGADSSRLLVSSEASECKQACLVRNASLGMHVWPATSGPCPVDR